jgi:hypothetical protein
MHLDHRTFQELLPVCFLFSILTNFEFQVMLHGEPLHHLIVDIVIMLCLFQRLHSSGLELGMTSVEALWPILAQRSNAIVSGRCLESGGLLTCDHNG